MSKILVGAGAVVLVGAGALLAAPAFIDWNQYRGQVATALELATGRTVAIAGDLDLALLTRPVLSAGGVTLSRPAGETAGEAPLAIIRSVDLSVRPWALLRGEVQVDNLALVEPRMRVELLADGTRVLPIDPGALGGSLRIDRLDVRNGSLTLLDRRGAEPAEVTVTAISGAADAGGIDGPYHFNGDFKLADQLLTLDITGGRTDGDAPIPVRATLTLPDGAAGRFAGVLDPGPAPTVKGEVRAEGRRLAPVLATLNGIMGRAEPPAAAPDQPFAIRAGLAWEPALLALDGIEASLGDSRAVGSAEFPLADGAGPGSIVLSFTRLDLDAWTGGDLPPLPRTGPYAIDLLADSVALGGGTLREASLIGRLEDGTLALERAAATLPGGLALSASGTVADAGGRPELDLAVAAETENLRETLTWAGLDVTHVPVERLRAARMTARIQGQPRDLRLADIAASVDTTKLTGAASYRGTGRPGMGLRVDVDRLDLDAYLAGRLPPRDRVAEWARDIDLTIEAGIGSLTAGGVPVEGLAIDGTLAQGALTLRDLSFRSAAGVSGKIAGQAAGLFPLDAGNLTFTAEAATLAPLFRALEVEPPVPTERLGAVKLSGRMVGGADSLALELDAGFLDGNVQAGGDLRTLDRTPTADLKVRATFPEVADVVRLVRPGWQPGRPRIGAMDLYAELAGPSDNLTARAIQGNVGPVTLSGQAGLDRTGAVPALTADLTTGPLDPALFFPVLGREDAGIDLSWTRDLSLSLDLAAERLTLPRAELEGVSLTLTGGEGTLDLGRLAGTWRGGALTAEGRLVQGAGTAEGPVPAAGSLRLSLTDAAWPEADSPESLDLVGGRFDLAFEGESKGADATALWQELAGSGRFTLRDTALTGIDLQRLSGGLGEVKGRAPAEALLKRTMTGGQTPIDLVEGPVRLENRVLTSEGLTARSPAGELILAGRLDLSADTLEAELALDPAAPKGAPDLTLALSGPTAAPVRQVRADDLLAWAAAKAAFVPPPPLVLQGGTADGIAGPPVSAAASPDPAPAEPAPSEPPPAERAAAPPEPSLSEPVAPADQPADRDTFIKGILEKLKDGSGS